MEDHIEQLWQYIGSNSASFHANFPQHSAAITHLLIECILTDGEVSTGYAVEGERNWAFVTMVEGDSDLKLSLRYHGE